MSKCCDDQCETESAQSCSASSCDAKPGCPSESDCPIDCAADMWKGSFFQAMREAQVDLLKAKIQKAWGPMMDKAADALLASVGARFEAMVAEVRAAEACHEFKGKLKDLWLEQKKK
jgi:hypothetical protein